MSVFSFTYKSFPSPFFYLTIFPSVSLSMADEIGSLFNKVSLEANDDDVAVLDDGLCTNHQTPTYSLISRMIIKQLLISRL